MGDIRRQITQVLTRLGTHGVVGGFWLNECDELIEAYEAEDDLSAEPNEALENPLRNDTGENETRTGDDGFGIEQEEHENAVSVGYVRNTAQRSGA